jgi:metal-responsive CopG/Arc/MetJ family transcriptional regulator
MLRSITIDNDMLRWLAKRINEEYQNGNEITRTLLSNLIWEYEKHGNE